MKNLITVIAFLFMTAGSAFAEVSIEAGYDYARSYKTANTVLSDAGAPFVGVRYTSDALGFCNLIVGARYTGEKEVRRDMWGYYSTNGHWTDMTVLYAGASVYVYEDKVYIQGSVNLPSFGSRNNKFYVVPRKFVGKLGSQFSIGFKTKIEGLYVELGVQSLNGTVETGHASYSYKASGMTVSSRYVF